MNPDVETLSEMRYWKVVPISPNTTTLHTKFAMKRKRHEMNIIQKHRDRLFVCGNEDDEID